MQRAGVSRIRCTVQRRSIVHYEVHARYACRPGMDTSGTMPANMSQRPEDVSCRLCLRVMAQAAQRLDRAAKKVKR